MSATDKLGLLPNGKASVPPRGPPNRKPPVPPRGQKKPPSRKPPMPPREQFDKIVDALVNGHWKLTTYDAHCRATELLDGEVNTTDALHKLSKSELRKFGFKNIDMIDMPTDVGVNMSATKSSNGIITIRLRFYNRGVGAVEGSQDTVIELPPAAKIDSLLAVVTLVDVGSEFELLDPDYNYDELGNPDYWPDNGCIVEYRVRCNSETPPPMCIGQVRIQTPTDNYLNRFRFRND